MFTPILRFWKYEKQHSRQISTTMLPRIRCTYTSNRKYENAFLQTSTDLRSVASIPPIAFSVPGSGKTQYILDVLSHQWGGYYVSGRVPPPSDADTDDALLNARRGSVSLDTRHLQETVEIDSSGFQYQSVATFMVEFSAHVYTPRPGSSGPSYHGVVSSCLESRIYLEPHPRINEDRRGEKSLFSSRLAPISDKRHREIRPISSYLSNSNDIEHIQNLGKRVSSIREEQVA